jgi:hypothetical protein
VLTTAKLNAAGTNGLTCLPKHRGTRDHPSDDRPSLLYFRDRTLKRTDRGAIELFQPTVRQELSKFPMKSVLSEEIVKVDDQLEKDILYT